MQFKHPEILWALFLIILPIIIHLFKLRKYRKEVFTNVQVLKQIRKQTNKQSQIKKWLILLMRSLCIICLVFAFSEPYFANRDILNNKIETVIYLDNSYSMQLQGLKGTLLQESINDLLQQLEEHQTFSLFTNAQTYENTTVKDLKEALITAPYSANQLSMEVIDIKARKLFSKENAIKNLLIISDFQRRDNVLDSLSEIDKHYIQLTPSLDQNTLIDSAFISSKSTDQYDIQVTLKTNDTQSAIPISLFNQDQLLAKSSANFEDGAATMVFSVPAHVKNGIIQINDQGLSYDNNLFFSLNEPQKINVLSINGSEDGFLKKIFSSEEFNYKGSSVEQLDFNILNQQNFIVLNELKMLSPALITALQQATERGIKICVIPENSDTYINTVPVFPFLGNLKFTHQINQKKLISTIAFKHPLFENVFEKSVSNFQYPEVTSNFQIQGNFQTVLGYEDKTDFLIETGGNYAFTAPINNQNSNFQKTPLIVPVFYNMATQSLPLPELYYTVGKSTEVAVKTQLENDRVLSLEKDEKSFIPRQINYQDHVSIITDDYPKEHGTYVVKNGDEELLSISYNHSREESSSIYLSRDQFPKDQTVNSVAQKIDELKSENNVRELWKWFAIFALIFLCLELLILKYYR